jgi:hypothetical protein
MEFHWIFHGIPWNFSWNFPWNSIEFHGIFRGIPWNYGTEVDGIPFQLTEFDGIRFWHGTCGCFFYFFLIRFILFKLNSYINVGAESCRSSIETQRPYSPLLQCTSGGEDRAVVALQGRHIAFLLAYTYLPLFTLTSI